MFDKLPNDIITEIQKHLSYLDYVNLKPVCKKTSQLKMEFRPIILNKLAKHVPNPEELLEKIKEFGAIITGSFILASINQNDSYNDIDIYENTTLDHATLSQYLFNQKEDFFRLTRRPLYDWKYRFELYKESYMVRDFMVKGTNLQHIRIDCDIIKYINNAFDLDICKNYFDGEKLHIRSVKKITEKYDYIKPNALLLNFYIQDKLEAKLEARLVKYTERGYTITRHPDYHTIIQHISDLKQGKNGLQTMFEYGYGLIRDNHVNLDEYYLE